MINATTLLKDLKKLLPGLENDLRARLEETPEEKAQHWTHYQEARAGGRTGTTWEAWRDERVTQAAAAWLLAGVFVRFMEDNGLIDQPWLSGPGERRRLAEDRRTLYFRSQPSHNDRDYFLHVFGEVAKYPAVGALFDRRFNPLWGMMPSGDGAAGLLNFWQRIDPDSGDLLHDFTDPDWNTRFLGDLYQDLSENIRKAYALLQTPQFVEAFILDRTLRPAIETFGFEKVRIIDPTCGSGHFLLSAFVWLAGLWFQQEPGTNDRELVQRALHSIHGVDLNPYAVAISRFRLLVEALRFCRITRLADAPGFAMHLAVGDSLLHGPRFQGGGMLQMTLDAEEDPLRHVYATEDKEALRRILGQQYHAVVGNPPYITPKDASLNQAYRKRFTASCHMKYSLGVPFTERFFELALPGAENRPAGFVGMITANSFMKREFGKKLIEIFFKNIDLDTVIDTSGAYIPGHGTPTVILFGRNRRPLLSVVRTVQGIRGEPSTPEDAAKGKVWRSIVEMIGQPGSENDFISVVDTPRATFATHPWSLGGGGAAELKELIEENSKTKLQEAVELVGVFGMTNADEIMLAPVETFARYGVEDYSVCRLVMGDQIRDWNIFEGEHVSFPYRECSLIDIENLPGLFKWFWAARTILGKRATFSKKTYFEEGRPWWEWHQVALERLRTPLSIAFAFVATHNHFVLDRGGKVFKQSAPVIKLPPGASEEEHLALLGLLNSSTACFWMKQTFHNKGSTVDQRGARQTTVEFENFYEFTGTGLKSYPIPRGTPLSLATQLDQLAQQRQSHLPAQLAFPLTRQELDDHRTAADTLLGRMIALQEELDWQCYRLYAILEEDLTFQGAPPEVRLGERPFEILMARRIADGELESTWFERHGSTPVTAIPEHWPADYRTLVERRLATVEKNHNLRLIEQPEYKRRWNLESWEDQERRALKGWLLDRIEAMPVWKTDAPALTTCARLADLLHHDGDFLRVATLYRGRGDFDLTALITELVQNEAVPFLPILRYKESGLRKRAAWEATWTLQRREDAGEQVGDIPVPPKYDSADFATTTCWQLRGKLDVPKERFVLYPHCQRETDPTPVIAWAGWNPLQQAQALAGYFITTKENEGWPPDRLTPLLAGLLELLPWLKQWHNEVDPAFGIGMGDYFAGFCDEAMRGLGVTEPALRAWRPPQIVHRPRKTGR
ncbi:MAG: BREX-2 system adenine-specific DNA-methyltransferase PglX [Magnetococcales bacterium]|nr:BREX-2 system adenine-specific DNA-methyltransferase PglX [Magnetococcales bacterium]